MDEQELESALAEARTAADPAQVLGPALESYRGRIERMLRFRLDPRLRGRVGVSDVIQDAYVEITRRLPEYVSSSAKHGGDSGGAGEGSLPLYAWVRFIAAQALAKVHRVHLGTVARDAGRDRLLGGIGTDGTTQASSLVFASALIGAGSSPSMAVIREERREALVDALEGLSETDREILFLRHFEQLPNRDVASIIGLSESGASLRHLKALRRLQAILERSGFSAELP